MKEELRVINAIVGMTLGGGSWPDPLYKLGYKLTAIQRPVALVFEGKPKEVVPEAILQSLDEDCSVLIESKSASIGWPQARKYLAVTARDLVDNGAIAEPKNSASHVSAPIYFCSAIHTDGSNDLLENVSEFNRATVSDLPLVDYDNHRFQLRTGTVRNPGLHSLFDGSISFSEGGWPTRLVPFDQDSPRGEIVGAVMMELISLLLDPSVEEFSVVQLAQGHDVAATDGAVPYFAQVGRQAAKKFRAILTEFVEDFRRHYASSYYIRNGNAQAWTKTRSLQSGSIASIRSKSNDYAKRVQQDLALPKSVQKPPLISQFDLEMDDD